MTVGIWDSFFSCFLVVAANVTVIFATRSTNQHFQLKHCHIFLQNDSKCGDSWAPILFRQVNTDQCLKIKSLMWTVLRLCGCCVINKTFREELWWVAVHVSVHSDNKQDTVLLSCASKGVYPGLDLTGLTFSFQGVIAHPPVWCWAFFYWHDVRKLCVLVPLTLCILWCFLTGHGCSWSHLCIHKDH